MSPYLGRWCPRCGNDSVPLDDGTCQFCDAPLLKEGLADPGPYKLYDEDDD